MANEEGKRAHADRMIAEAIRNRQTREAGYREQALKIYPWICGRCSREFTRETVQQLTVHHKDHNHDNNPPDGSNWELLCIYCHDNEHEVRTESYFAGGRAGNEPPSPIFSPFAGLDELISLPGDDSVPEEKPEDKR